MSGHKWERLLLSNEYKVFTSIDNNWIYVDYLLTAYCYVHSLNLNKSPIEFHLITLKHTFSNVSYEGINESLIRDKCRFITVHC
jgi:hypothetical protein